MRTTKLMMMGIAVLSVSGLWAMDLDKQIKDLNDKEKAEASPLETQVSAVNAKYAATIAALEKQMSELKAKLKAEMDPVEAQLKTAHDKYAPKKKAVMDAIDLKIKLTELTKRETLEKKAMADKKDADLKNKAMKPADVNKKYGDDMKAMETRYKTDRANLDAAYKKAVAEVSKK